MTLEETLLCACVALEEGEMTADALVGCNIAGLATDGLDRGAGKVEAELTGAGEAKAELTGAGGSAAELSGTGGDAAELSGGGGDAAAELTKPAADIFGTAGVWGDDAAGTPGV